jgi:hypothetical protein
VSGPILPMAMVDGIIDRRPISSLWKELTCLANHPNRGWRKKLTIDLEKSEVRYLSGLVVTIYREAQGLVGRVTAGHDTVHVNDHAARIENAVTRFTKAEIWRDLEQREQASS